MDMNSDIEEHLLAIYVSDVLSNVINELASSKKKLSCEDIEDDYYPIPKRVRFRSPLVSVKELSIDKEDSFGPLDDTLPLEDNFMTGEASSEILEQIVPTRNSQLFLMMVQSPMFPDSSTSICHKRKNVESYHDFVHELYAKTRRLSDTEEVHVDVCNEMEGLVIQSTPDDDGDDILPTDNDYDILSDNVNFVSYHVLSYALREYKKLLLKPNNTEMRQKHEVAVMNRNGKSGIYKPGNTEVIPQCPSKFQNSVDCLELFYENMEISDLRDQSTSEVSEVKQDLRRWHGRPVINCDEKKSYGRDINLTCERLSREERRTFNNEFSLEELQSFLIPEVGHEYLVSQYEILSAEELAKDSCENTIDICFAGSTEQFHSSPMESFTQPVEPIGNKIEIDKEDNLMFVDEKEFLSPLKLPSNQFSSSHKLMHHEWKRKPIVDDMISELMASQTARPKWICDDLAPIPQRPIPKSHSTHSKSEKCWVNPFEEIPVVPDVDNLPELDSDYGDTTRMEETGRRRQITVDEDRNFYSWKDSFNSSEFESPDRSFQSPKDGITPPKLRLGLSKRTKVKKVLHPYRSNASQ